ncbi:MAG: RraA family protein [Cloacibacillus sp.]|nr:RraA family protein [Cloacibacillus sp.]
MSVGFRIFQSITRPAKEIVSLFQGLPVANIADNMGRLYCVESEIRPFNKVPLLGTAFTVKVAGGDNLMFHKAIELAQPGDVIVVNGFGAERALCGGLMMETARQKGIKGFVIDGYIRDNDDILNMTDFSCYARGLTGNGPYKNGPGEIGGPVALGKQVVMPGDIIVGDADGIIVVPKDDAERIALESRKLHSLEQKKLAAYANGNVNREWLYDALKSKGCEIID